MPKGRPRQFDIEDALHQATLVFWRKGYRGTSLDDLTEAMQINRPSLYSAFGDKEELFLSVVEHYRKTFIMPVASELMQCTDLRQGLTEFFAGMATIVLGQKDTPPGCLIACLLTEECCDSEVIRSCLSGLIANGDHAFTSLFQRFSQQLNNNLTPAEAGKLMTTTLHGMAIRARSGGTSEDLRQISKTFIACVIG